MEATSFGHKQILCLRSAQMNRIEGENETGQDPTRLRNTDLKTTLTT